MKKITVIAATLVLVICFASANSFAYSFGIEQFSGTYQYGNTDQGNYLGTVFGANDSDAILLEFLNVYKGMNVTSLSVFGKTDQGTLFTPLLESGSDGGYISGTWQTYNSDNTPATPDLIDLLVVKGGTSFSVHYYDPAASGGQWSVGYLDEVGKKGINVPTLSHISAYVQAPAPVPEPATLLLLGVGLIGLAGLGRKKIVK